MLGGEGGLGAVSPVAVQRVEPPPKLEYYQWRSHDLEWGTGAGKPCIILCI